MFIYRRHYTISIHLMPDALVANLLNLAKKIHQDYVSKRAEEGKEEYQDWDTLPDDIKNSNIRQAMKIPIKLEAIGCFVGTGEEGIVVDSFTDDEIQVLSMKEHELWVDEREESGWTYGAKKDVEKKVSPYIAPWEDIPPDVQQYDIDTTMNIIPLLDSVGLKVCRPRENDQVLKDFRYSHDRNVPIIISVTGHRDIPEGYSKELRRRTSELIDSFRSRYQGVPLMLMSALAEGADRIVAKVAMEKGVPVAPVFPIPENRYIETFDGTGYGSREESLEDFHYILNHELTYSPCVLCDSRTNILKAYRILAGYLVTNSHVIVSAWDGRRYGVKGGTYDAIRMALFGTDPDIADSINPMTSVSANTVISPVRYLDTSDNALVFWVEVGRESSRDALLNRMCRDADRDAGTYCGFVAKNPEQDNRTITDRLKAWYTERKRAPVYDTQSCPPRETLIEDIDITGRLTTKIPKEYDDQFLRMAEFNKEISIIPERDAYDTDGFGLLTSNDPGTEAVKAAGCMEDMARRYDSIYALSEQYRMRSRRMTIWLIMVTAI